MACKTVIQANSVFPSFCSSVNSVSQIKSKLSSPTLDKLNASVLQKSNHVQLMQEILKTVPLLQCNDLIIHTALQNITNELLLITSDAYTQQESNSNNNVLLCDNVSSCGNFLESKSRIDKTFKTLMKELLLRFSRDDHICNCSSSKVSVVAADTRKLEQLLYLKSRHLQLMNEIRRLQQQKEYPSSTYPIIDTTRLKQSIQVKANHIRLMQDVLQRAKQASLDNARDIVTDTAAVVSDDGGGVSKLYRCGGFIELEKQKREHENLMKELLSHPFMCAPRNETVVSGTKEDVEESEESENSSIEAALTENDLRILTQLCKIETGLLHLIIELLEPLSDEKYEELRLKRHYQALDQLYRAKASYIRVMNELLRYQSLGRSD